MSDLIRKSDVIDLLYKVFEKHSMATDKNSPLGGFGAEVFESVKAMSTAYDIDNVVEELKELKEDALGEYNMGEYNLDNNIGNRIAENYRKDMNEGKCFAYDLYLTECQQRQLIFDGTPKENGYRYCPTAQRR